MRPFLTCPVTPEKALHSQFSFIPFVFERVVRSSNYASAKHSSYISFRSLLCLSTSYVTFRALRSFVIFTAYRNVLCLLLDLFASSGSIVEQFSVLYQAFFLFSVYALRFPLLIFR